MVMIKFILILLPILAIGAVAWVLWYFYMKVRFKTISSNEAGIVTGTNLGNEKTEKNIIKDENGRYMKIIRGGGHRLRMFQSFDRISLSSFQLELTTPKIYTGEGVGIYGKAIAAIKLADENEGIVQYAEQFLGKDQKDIEKEVAEVLGGNLRAILSRMTVEQINGDREKFNEEVRRVAQEQLDRMGFFIVSLSLIDLWDDDEYLVNLGKPKVSEIKKTADIAESTNKRATSLHVSKMDQEVAEDRYEREMQVAEARKVKDIKDAQILAQTSKENARSESAYRLEEEELNFVIESKRLAVVEQEKTVNLRLERLERENQVKLEKEQVEVQKQKAEGDFFKIVREAEGKSQAVKFAGEAEADRVRQLSAANVEDLENRAEAMAKHKEVIITEKMIEMLPKYATAISSSINNVESIRIMDSGGGDQLSSLPNMVTEMMAKTSEGLGQMTGIDLEEIVNNLSKPSQHTNETNYHANSDVETVDESIDKAE